MFDWLSDIVRWMGRLIPRLIIVRTTHNAVAFTRGKHARALAPGLHWLWPVVTDHVMYPTVRQSVNLNTQTLITKDNQTVAVGAVIVYSVDNVLELVGNTHDPDDTVRDLSMAAVKSYVVTATLDDLRQSKMDRRLTRRIARSLVPFGVNVIRAQMTDLSPCVVIKLWNEPYTITQGAP
jgi:regulator of protease activity HflC (stomatin/prohibitin superfamily)